MKSLKLLVFSSLLLLGTTAFAQRNKAEIELLNHKVDSLEMVCANLETLLQSNSVLMKNQDILVKNYETLIAEQNTRIAQLEERIASLSSAAGLSAKIDELIMALKTNTPKSYEMIDGEAYCSNLMLVKEQGRFAYINRDGEIAFPLRFDYAYGFSSDGYAYVKNEDKWGVIDTSGKFIIECVYTDIKDYSNGFFLVERNGKYGVFSVKSSSLVLPEKYDCFESEKGGYYKFGSGKKRGLFSLGEGKVLIPVQYDAVEYLTDGLYRVASGSKVGAYSIISGKEVLPVQYDRIRTFSERFGVCEIEADGKSGFINKEGKIVVSVKYYGADLENSGKIKVYDTYNDWNYDNNGYYIDLNGRRVN